jgi:cytoskeleton protein RodZ
MTDSDIGQGFDAIGARLRSGRERVGMNVAQAAEKLHCDRQLIEALEAGRFKEIGAPVFARGHLRRYAELVGEPIGELLERFDAAAAGRVMLPDLTSIPRARRTRDTRRLLWPAVIAVAVVVFGVLISWVLRDSPLPALAGLTDSVSGTEAQTDVASPAAQSDGVTVVVDASADGGTPLDVTSAVQADAGSVTPPMAAPMGAALRPGETEFGIRVTGDCWLEIYDADRDRLYFDLLRRGGQAQVRGTPPFRVLLGNAAAATIQVAGAAVAVPRAAIRGNAAFLSLAADGTASAIQRD